MARYDSKSLPVARPNDLVELRPIGPRDAVLAELVLDWWAGGCRCRRREESFFLVSSFCSISVFSIVFLFLVL